ncbi:hypothetical protein ACIGFK_19010 [Streptomyces sp. NPDC085524]
MYRNGHRIGDPSGPMRPEGIADIVTRAAACVGLTTRSGRVIPDGAAC